MFIHITVPKLHVRMAFINPVPFTIAIYHCKFQTTKSFSEIILRVTKQYHITMCREPHTNNQN